MRERIEEILLVIVAAIMLVFVGEGSLATDILAALGIAFLLILVLFLRSIDWRKEGIHHYDWVLLAGVGLSLLHLVSFQVLDHTLLSAAVALAFSLFYTLMGVLLFQHRFLFAQ